MVICCCFFFFNEDSRFCSRLEIRTELQLVIGVLFSFKFDFFLCVRGLIYILYRGFDIMIDL